MHSVSLSMDIHGEVFSLHPTLTDCMHIHDLALLVVRHSRMVNIEEFPVCENVGTTLVCLCQYSLTIQC